MLSSDNSDSSYVGDIQSQMQYNMKYVINLKQNIILKKIKHMKCIYNTLTRLVAH